MFKGISFALSACFIWGLIFVVPQFMTGFTSVEVALGRNLVYGIISSIFFCKLIFQGRCKYSRAVWIKVLYFSLVSTMGYYTCVVLALRYSAPAICTLILGISPIAIAFYGNFKEKETTFRSLIVPSALILIGLIIINIPHVEACASISGYILGLGCTFLALIGWSWYVVANARFLKDNPEVSSSDWSTLIGVVALFWVGVFALGLGVFFDNQLQIEKYLTPSPELTSFLVGSAILGVLCSWVGAYLWNKASLHLPVSLAGQITIFETIFGVLFVYIVESHMPPLMEGIGIAILLIAIVYGIRQFAKKKTGDGQLSLH